MSLRFGLLKRSPFFIRLVIFGTNGGHKSGDGMLVKGRGSYREGHFHQANGAAWAEPIERLGSGFPKVAAINVHRLRERHKMCLE